MGTICFRVAGYRLPRQRASVQQRYMRLATCASLSVATLSTAAAAAAYCLSAENGRGESWHAHLLSPSHEALWAFFLFPII
jgi:hypothetical protein